MDTFHHSPIDLTQPTFRLVRILANSGVDINIQCEIIDACFDQPEALIPYEALSYTWGSNELVEEIKLDGRSFRVTDNLYIALRYLRFENEDRIVWIDALCIDQGSYEGEEEEKRRKEKEKAQQIQQMDSIYRRAERVIFWLGPATYETNVIMDSMKRMEEESNKYPSSNEVRKNVWLNIQPELRSKHSNLEVMQRAGLERIFNRPWFRRVWILQEVANANHGILACGTRSVSTRMFAPTLSLLSFKPEAHCQSVVDIMPGSSREQTWWNENRDLYTLLVKFGRSKATDPRDHIRALLGISSDAKDGALLQAETIQELIKNTTSFLLDFADLRKINFPPDDWTMAQFLDNISCISNIALVWAQNANNARFMERLLARHDIDVNFKDKDGQTVLSRAVSQRQAEIFALLLAREDINVNVKNKEGRTPLHIAVIEWKVDIVRQLLARDDIDINLKDEEGQTVLSRALHWRHAEIFALLIARKDIDVNIKDKEGRAPLHIAVTGRKMGMVRELLERDEIDVNIKDKEGKTLLYIAASARELGLIRQLLLARDDIDVKIKDKEGRMLLHAVVGEILDIAVTEKEVDMVRKLPARDDIDVNFKHEGRTILQRALNRGEVSKVGQLLAREDIDVNLKYEGRTILHGAVSRGEESIVRQLLTRDDIDVGLEVTNDILSSMDIVNSNNAIAFGLFLAHPRIVMAQSTTSDSSKIAWSPEKVTRRLVTIHVIKGSLVDRIDYYGRFIRTFPSAFPYNMQYAQTIEDRLDDQNHSSILGNKDPRKFAKSVYDFIEMRIHKAKGEKHRFFVYHPSNYWYSSFHQLIWEKRFPPTFCAKSNDLARLCQHMQSIRAAIKDESRGGNDVVFHLLIPAEFSISVDEPLHFPEALQPFYIEGQKRKGKNLVTLNLPTIPRDCLIGVVNSYDPVSDSVSNPAGLRNLLDRVTNLFGSG